MTILVDEPLLATGWPLTSTWQDAFTTKDTTHWWWSAYQTAGVSYDNELVLKSVGTGSGWQSTFYDNLSPGWHLGTGKGIEVQFQVTATNTQAHFCIEANDATYRRFGAIADAGKLYVQTIDGDGSTARYPVDLITNLQVNHWYVVRIVIDDSGRGFYIEAYDKENPSIRGSYNTWRPTGKSWRFRHYIYRGTAYIDNYREIDTSMLVWSPDERLSPSYDALDRLTGVTKSATAQQGYNATYGYNEIGNITGKTEAGTTWSYTYGGSKPHAVTSYAQQGGPTYTYEYDANGSMITRSVGSTYAITYNVEGKMVLVTEGGNSYSFTYDGDGNRVKSTIGGVTTLHVGDHYEKVGNVIRKYYFFNGKRIAMREDGTLYWLLGDQLSSTSMALSITGTVQSQQRYMPFGVARNVSGALPTDYRYTGQQEVPSIGLYDYNARWYDPYLNRWIQPDTVVPNPGDPQSLNRFSYVRNNPLRYVDPSGHFPAAVMSIPGQSVLGLGVMGLGFVSPIPDDALTIAYGVTLIATDPLWQMYGPYLAGMADKAGQIAQWASNNVSNMGGPGGLKPDDFDRIGQQFREKFGKLPGADKVLANLNSGGADIKQGASWQARYAIDHLKPEDVMGFEQRLGAGFPDILLRQGGRIGFIEAKSYASFAGMDEFVQQMVGKQWVDQVLGYLGDTSAYGKIVVETTGQLPQWLLDMLKSTGVAVEVFTP